MKIITLKLPWDLKCFNKNQKVFVETMTGQQACLCRGRFRGKGRWISAWFRWNDKNKHLFNFKIIDIKKADYNSIFKKLGNQ